MATSPIKNLDDTVEKLSDTVVDLSKIVDKLGNKIASSVKTTHDLAKNIRISATSASSLVNTFLKFKDASDAGVKSMRKFNEISSRISKDVGLRRTLHNGLYREHLESEERILSTKIQSLAIEEKMGQTMRSRMSTSSDLTKFEKASQKINKSIERNQIEQNKQFDIARDLRAKTLKLNREIKQATTTLGGGVNPQLSSKIASMQVELRSAKTKLHDTQIEIRRLDGVILKETGELLELEKARGKEISKTLKDEKIRAGYFRHLKDTGSDLLGVLGDAGGKMTAFLDKVNNLPIRFLILDALLASATKRFVHLDKAAEEFRRQTGFGVDQMNHIRTYAERINVEFADMGVSIDKAYEASKALTDQFQLTSLVTEEAVKNIALMSANLNVAESDSAQVLSTFQGLGGMSEKLAFNVMKVGAGMSNKIGVPFSLVMKDIANATETTVSLLSTNPTMLMRSAIAARTLGADLNKITQSQRKLLDFSSSINDELELSALLGTSISFQKSRQLAYEGRIEDAAKSTLETVKAAGNFDKMSVYQREALAKAAGMELKDLSKMLAVDKKRSDILNGTDQAAKDKLAMQDAELKKLSEMNDLSKQSLADQYEAEIRQQKMQGLISQYNNILQSVLIDVGSMLEPIIRAAVTILVPVVRVLSKLIHGLATPFQKLSIAMTGTADTGKRFQISLEKVYSFVEKIGEGVAYTYYYLNTFSGLAMVVGKNFDAVGVIFKSISKWSSTIYKNMTSWAIVGRIFSPITAIFQTMLQAMKPLSSLFGTMVKGSSLFGTIAKVIGKIASVAGPIGVVINAVQLLFNVGRQLLDIWSGDNMNIGEKILRSVVALPKALWNVLVQPFIDLAAWVLNKIWPGVGNGMIAGIKSVGESIFAVLKAPFQKLFGWFKDESGIAGQSPSEIGMMLVNGIKSVGELVFGFITSPFRRALEFVKNIPLFGKLFGGSDISMAVSPDISTDIKGNNIVEIKNIDLLNDAIYELTAAISGMKDGIKGQPVATQGNMNTSAIEQKLDTLTNLLVGGAIAVYLDGSKISGKMARLA